MENRFDLIVTIVNRGISDLVMDAARAAGASGGTILHGRGTGVHEAERFFGIEIQPEQESVLSLTRSCGATAALESRSAPDPAMSFAITWPMRTGALTRSARSAFNTSGILSLAIAPEVRTAHTGRSPPSTATSEVTTRTGALTSWRQYSSPRLHWFP